MRKKQRLQTSLFDHYVEHDIGNELKNISMILDQHIEVLDWVEKDIQTINLKDESGRKGMSVESILRCAILNSIDISVMKNCHLPCWTLYRVKHSPD